MEKVVAPVQAPRLHLPVGRDLRRLPLDLRLRPARRQPAAQRQERLVGVDGAARATTSSASTPPSCRPPAVWAASGHLATFTDPLVDCMNCHQRWREDKIDGVCPNCGSTDVHRGPGLQPHVQDPRRPAGGRGRAWPTCAPRRPRACSSTSLNVLQTTRKKPPFGIAQVGKSFRNEITPQNFVFRTREFEQMEMEYFVPPAEAQQWFEYWLDRALPLVPRPRASPTDQLRLRHHEASELSHYSSGTADVEFLFPWGWDELEGIANRADFDLKAHAAASGEKLEYFDQASQRALRAPRDRAGRRRHPHDDGLPAGRLRRGRGRRRGPHRCCACTRGWPPTRWRCCRCRRRRRSSRWPARCSALLQPHFMCDYDTTQSIGKRYRRQDEVGHAVVRHGRLRLARGRRRHRPRPRHHRAGAGADRRAAGRAPPAHGRRPA